MNTPNSKDISSSTSVNSQDSNSPKRTIPLPNINKLPTLQQLQKQASKKVSTTAVPAVSSVKPLARVADTVTTTMTDTTNTINPVTVHLNANTPIDTNVSPFAEVKATTTTDTNKSSIGQSPIRDINSEALGNDSLKTSTVKPELNSLDLEQVNHTLQQAKRQNQQAHLHHANEPEDLNHTHQTIPSLFTSPTSSAVDPTFSTTSASTVDTPVMQPTASVNESGLPDANLDDSDYLNLANQMVSSDVSVTTNSHPNITTTSYPSVTTDSNESVSSFPSLDPEPVSVSPIASTSSLNIEQTVDNLNLNRSVENLDSLENVDDLDQFDHYDLDASTSSAFTVDNTTNHPVVDVSEEEDFLTRYNNGHLDLPEFDPEFFADSPASTSTPPAPQPITTATSFNPKMVTPPKVVGLAVTKVPLVTPTVNTQTTKPTINSLDSNDHSSNHTADQTTKQTVASKVSAARSTNDNLASELVDDTPVIFTPVSESELNSQNIQTTPYGTVDDLASLITHDNNATKLTSTSIEPELKDRSIAASQKLDQAKDYFKVPSHPNPSVNYNSNNATMDATDTESTEELDQDFVYVDPTVSTANQSLDTDYSYSSDTVGTNSDHTNANANANANQTNTEITTISSVTNHNPNDLADEYSDATSVLAVNDLADPDHKSHVKANSQLSPLHQPSSESSSIDSSVNSSNPMPQTTETNVTTPQSQYHVRTEDETANTTAVETVKTPVRVKRPSVLASSIPHKGESYDYVHNRIATFFGIVAFLAVVGLVAYLAYILFKIIW